MVLQPRSAENARTAAPSDFVLMRARTLVAARVLYFYRMLPQSISQAPFQLEPSNTQALKPGLPIFVHEGRCGVSLYKTGQ